MPNPISTREGIDRFIADMTVEIPHVIDGRDRVWRKHDVFSQPAWLFVSSDGSVERVRSPGRTGLLWRMRDLT